MPDPTVRPSARSTLSRPSAPSRTAAASAAALGRSSPDHRSRTAASATPLHVQHKRPVHQHDQCARLAARPVRRGCPPGRSATAAPPRTAAPDRRQLERVLTRGDGPPEPPRPPASGPRHRAGRTAPRPDPRRNSRAGWPASSMARSTGYTAAKPPGSARRRPRPWSARHAAPAASGPARARGRSARRRRRKAPVGRYQGPPAADGGRAGPRRHLRPSEPYRRPGRGPDDRGTAARAGAAGRRC